MFGKKTKTGYGGYRKGSETSLHDTVPTEADLTQSLEKGSEEEDLPAAQPDLRPLIGARNKDRNAFKTSLPDAMKHHEIFRTLDTSHKVTRSATEDKKTKEERKRQRQQADKKATDTFEQFRAVAEAQERRMDAIRAGKAKPPTKEEMGRAMTRLRQGKKRVAPPKDEVEIEEEEEAANEKAILARAKAGRDAGLAEGKQSQDDEPTEGRQQAGLAEGKRRKTTAKQKRENKEAMPAVQLAGLAVEFLDKMEKFGGNTKWNDSKYDPKSTDGKVYKNTITDEVYDPHDPSSERPSGGIKKLKSRGSTAREAGKPFGRVKPAS